MTTNSQGNTPLRQDPIEAALTRLQVHIFQHAPNGTTRDVRTADVAVVLVEIIRLRRHSEALGLLVAEMAPRPEIAVGPPGLEQFAAVLEMVITHIATDPRELDLIADAIIESRRARGPGPSVVN